MTVTAIAQRRRGPAGAAAWTTVIWDVDRTLIHGDSLLPFLRRVAGSRVLAQAPRDAATRAFGPDRRTEAKRFVLQRCRGARQPLGTLLGAHEVICIRMEVVNGWLTGRMSTSNCRRPAKLHRAGDYLAGLTEAPGPRGLVWVYANGQDDRPLRNGADGAIKPGRFMFLAELRES
jgi:phosphoserine phosphatase